MRKRTEPFAQVPPQWLSAESPHASTATDTDTPLVRPPGISCTCVCCIVCLYMCVCMWCVRYVWYAVACGVLWCVLCVHVMCVCCGVHVMCGVGCGVLRVLGGVCV